eukprot:11167242-Lingulodinium_polyedra.AAC.1
MAVTGRRAPLQGLGPGGPRVSLARCRSPGSGAAAAPRVPRARGAPQARRRAGILGPFSPRLHPRFR